MSNAAELRGWIPYRVDWRGQGPEVDWCYLGERTLHEPFFEQTIRAVLADPFQTHLRQRTPLDALIELERARPGLPLAGMIFHMSRCGSTVVSRQLAALSHHVVLAEAPPIDEVLDTVRRGASAEQRVAWLRAVVAALGQPRTGHEQRVFIKLDSWHILDLPLIRQAFPDTPWIFLYRDPIEVLVSHQRLRGSQMIPGHIPPERLGLDASAVGPPFDFDSFCARVLGNFCRAAAQYVPAHNGLLVNYEQFPDALWSIILPHFNVGLSQGEREQLELELLYNAKQPGHPFQPDSANKRSAASERSHSLAERYVAAAYRELEQLRQALGDRPSGAYASP